MCRLLIPIPCLAQVGSTTIDAEVYSSALAASAAAKQQRYTAAASAPTPFAVRAGEGGMAGVPSGEAYHYHKPERAEPAAKVGDGGYHYHKPQQVEPAGKVGAIAGSDRRQNRPSDQAEASGKVGC